MEFKDWGTIRKINNLAGTIACFFLIFIVLMAREPIRRKMYQVRAGAWFAEKRGKGWRGTGLACLDGRCTVLWEATIVVLPSL